VKNEKYPELIWYQIIIENPVSSIQYPVSSIEKPEKEL